MRRLAVVIAGLLLVAGPAASQRISIGLGLGLTFVGGVAGPIDGFGAPAAAAYSFRLLRSAYLGTGAAVRLRRASDQAESDIGFSGSGGFDTVSAATFCAATTCFVKTWYDQSGNARHATMATTTQQPTLVFNCIGTLPCMQAIAYAALQTASITPASPVSLSAVANRSVGTGQVFLFAFGNNYLTLTTATTWVLSIGAGFAAQTATENAWHAAAAVANGAASVLRVDAGEGTGTATVDATPGQMQVAVGNTATTVSFTEAIAWNGYALTAAERTALTANQQKYWMPAPLDTFSPPAAAYSFRRLKSTYTANKAVQLRRASDNAVLDIGFTAAGDFDTAAATTHCNATSCFVAVWYDQSGLGRDTVQPTAANQPALVFNCNGTLPCSQITAAVQSVATVASITPATGVLSMSLVMERLAGTAECGLRQNGNANQIRAGTATANLWWLNLGGVQAAASEAAWHVGLGVWNGASTSLSIDGGTAVTGSITNVTSGVTQFFGTDTTTCRFAEGIIWDNYALTAAERTALTANQRAYFGF